MRGRGERNERCHLDAGHEPHVFRSMDQDNPCGGGSTPLDKDADRRLWDRPISTPETGGLRVSQDPQPNPRTKW